VFQQGIGKPYRPRVASEIGLLIDNSLFTAVKCTARDPFSKAINPDTLH